MSSERRSYRARWIVSVSSEPIADGTIEIENGIITALHDRHDPRATDLGNVAILPGLINAHTHLEFSDVTAPIEPAQPFSGWIRNVVANRRSRIGTDSRACVERGRDESLAAGVTALGEIATDDASLHILADGPRAIVFRELRGLQAAKFDEQYAVAVQHLDAAGSANVTHGLSPHAPYSVHPRLYHALVDLAKQRRAPLAVHLAETAAELELLRDGTGDLRGLLDEFGVWEPGALERGSRPLDYLRPLDGLDHALVIHGNYLDTEEQQFIAARENLTVVYCPRTHAYFGHALHPWKSLRQAGARVVIGTDSRASNPDLSVWNELLFLHEAAPEIAPLSLLRMATCDAADALGFGNATGRLEPGLSADVCLIALAGDRSEIAAYLLESQNQPAGCMLRGEWVRPPVSFNRG